MKILCVALLFGVAVALPTSKAGADADEVVKNSWSASNLNNRVADADEVVKNSWSASNLNNRVADADEVVKNSWSASNLDNRLE